MDRRRFLALTGAGALSLSGCTRALPGPPGSETPLPHDISGDACSETTERPTTDTAPAVQDSEVLRRVRVKSTWPVGSIVPLVPRVDVVRGVITPDQTARIRLTLKNVADGTVYHVGHSGFPTGWRNFTPDASDPDLVLLPSKSDFEPETTECWQTTLSEQEYFDRFIHPHGGSYSYEGCERKSTTFDLFGHPSSNDCLPTGDFPFFEPIRVSRTEDSGSVEWDYSWQFTLSVESP